MRVILILVLLALAAGSIKSGLLPALFPIGYGIYWLINVKVPSGADSIDSFFAWIFFAIILGILFTAGKWLISVFS